MPTLTTVVGSMKPAPGSTVLSACREINQRCVAVIGEKFPFIHVLDIRDIPLPPYQGLAPGTHPDGMVRTAREALRASDAVSWVVPAYLGTLGGALKSFVEVTAGSPYASATPWESPLSGTPSIGLVIGDCGSSAEGGSRDLTAMLEQLDSPLVAPVITVADPTDEAKAETAARRYLVTLGQLAVHVLKASNRA